MAMDVLDLEALKRENATQKETIAQLQDKLRIAELKINNLMVRDLKPKREPQLGSAGSGLPILLGSVGTDAARLKSEDKEDVKLKFKTDPEHSGNRIKTEHKQEDTPAIRNPEIKSEAFPDAPNIQPVLTTENNEDSIDEYDPNDMNYSARDLGPTTAIAPAPAPAKVQERPKKRRRIMAEVLLPRVQRDSRDAQPSIKSLRKPAKAELDDEITTSLAALRNTKYKIKEEPGFSIDVAYNRLQAVGLDILPVPEGLQVEPVRRYFLCNTYGGGNSETFPRIDPRKVAKHGFDHFMFLRADYQPYAPQKPGAPGLYFSIEPDDTIVKILWRSFISVQGDYATWLYCGQYEIIPNAALSTDEWRTQSRLTKNTWLTKMRDKPWGAGVKTRVASRKVNKRNPSAAEISKVSISDIEEAFNTGEEKIHVWAVKCRGYDEVFAKDMMKKYPRWTIEFDEKDNKKKSGHLHGKSIGTRKRDPVFMQEQDVSKVSYGET